MLSSDFWFCSFVGGQKEVPISNTTLRSRNDPISVVNGGGSRGFGLPPPAKFRSGHIPASAIPVSSVNSGSNSDNDDSVDSEEEVYGGRYSLDSSPQDPRVPSDAPRRYGNLTQRRPQYGSDYTYSEVSSSRETLVGRPGVVRDPLMRGIGNVRQSGFTEDESDDSAASSEFSTTQVGSVNGTVPRSRAYVSEGYASSVPSRMNMQSAAKKVCNGYDRYNILNWMDVVFLYTAKNDIFRVMDRLGRDMAEFVSFAPCFI